MNVELDIEARKDVPRWLRYGTPIFTVVAALAVGGLAMVAIGVNPIPAYFEMFVGTLTSNFGLSETIIKAIPLVFAGLAVYFPLKAGLWNIGAEGQLVMGAIAGSYIAINVSLSSYLLLPTMFVGAGVLAAIWAGIPAWLRAKWDVNEIITTLLLSFVALEVKNYLVRGPMQGGTGNFPQTAPFPSAAMIPDVFGQGIHAGVFVMLLAIVVTYVLINKTRLGFEITFVGSNDEAAEQAGMSKFKTYMLVFIIGGVAAGFAGISEIAGQQGVLRANFEPGYGFTAIPIALLGRNGPFRVMLAGGFFALLFVGGSLMEILYGVPAALIEVIQALVILFLLTAEFFKSYHIGIDVTTGKQPEPAPATPEGGDD